MLWSVMGLWSVPALWLCYGQLWCIVMIRLPERRGRRDTRQLRREGPGGGAALGPRQRRPVRRRRRPRDHLRRQLGRRRRRLSRAVAGQQGPVPQGRHAERHAHVPLEHVAAGRGPRTGQCRWPHSRMRRQRVVRRHVEVSPRAAGPFLQRRARTLAGSFRTKGSM